MSSISEQIVKTAIKSGDNVLLSEVISVLESNGVILPDNITYEDITDLAEADGEIPYFEFETEEATMAAIRDYLEDKDCPSCSNIELKGLFS